MHSPLLLFEVLVDPAGLEELDRDDQQDQGEGDLDEDVEGDEVGEVPVVDGEVGGEELASDGARGEEPRSLVKN